MAVGALFTESEVLKLKTRSLYHDNLLLQKFNDMITHVHKYFLSASNIMEAVRGHFRFYGMNVIQLLFLLSLDLWATLNFFHSKPVHFIMKIYFNSTHANLLLVLSDL